MDDDIKAELVARMLHLDEWRALVDRAARLVEQYKDVPESEWPIGVLFARGLASAVDDAPYKMGVDYELKQLEREL